MEWRCIDTKENSGAYNMAVDETFIEAVASGESIPILRFYGWKPSCVSIGYFQRVASSIDLVFCRENGIHVVRRITGGRTVLHQKEIAYSIVIPESHEFVKGSITEAYKKISIGLLEGLKLCGIKAEFSPGILHASTSSACFEASSKYEIVIGGKKLVGSAQTRKKGVVLQHGSIILDFDEAIFANCLGLSSDLRKKFIVDYKQKAASIFVDSGKNFSAEFIIEKIKKGFEEYANVNIIEDNITKLEDKRLISLKVKYSSEEWTHLKV